MKRLLGLPIVLSAALALSSCGSDRPKGFVCPGSAALVDAASQVVLRTGSSDPSDIVYRVDIAKVISDCDYDPDTNIVTARIQIDFTASRPPQGDSAQYTVPYFVGIADGNTIVDKKLYNMQFAFAPGQANATFSDRVENFTMQPSPDKKATDYEFLAGLQITQAQLDYNRKVGRFPQ